jgi:hypothetical protein
MKKMIEALQVNEEITFTFQNEEFTITRFDERSNRISGCSISKKGSWINTMNVEKVTSKYITVYNFDMMNQKTTFKFPINEIKSLTKTQ